MIFTPSPPQILAVEHLEKSPLALLFVGMGIGKTGACLAAMDSLLAGCGMRAALIIAPIRVCNLTWPGEVAKFRQFRWMRIANLRTAEGRSAFERGEAEIYLINYEALPMLAAMIARMEARSKKQRKPFSLPYNVEVWDETTKAKNPSSKRINAFRRKLPRCDRRWGLTGTPAPNSLLDLFAQVRLIDDGARLGKTFSQFKSAHFEKADYMGYLWKEKAMAKHTIEDKISDITLTLRSSDWLNIPDTVIEDVEVVLSSELRKKYEDFEREAVLKLLEETEITAANSATLITKLLQFTSGAIYDAEKKWHPVHGHKLNALKRIEGMSKEPILVACIYQHEQERIRASFPHAEFFVDANTIEKQESLITRWNARKVQMLVAHPGSIGHGLNLQHGASRMIWMSLTYSRELYEQMIARLARRGQDEVTTVYRLMIPGTVDDVIASALEDKRGKEQRLLSALMQLESYRAATSNFLN